MVPRGFPPSPLTQLITPLYFTLFQSRSHESRVISWLFTRMNSEWKYEFSRRRCYFKTVNRPFVSNLVSFLKGWVDLIRWATEKVKMKAEGDHTPPFWRTCALIFIIFLLKDCECLNFNGTQILRWLSFQFFFELSHSNSEFIWNLFSKGSFQVQTCREMVVGEVTQNLFNWSWLIQFNFSCYGKCSYLFKKSSDFKAPPRRNEEAGPD